MLGMRKIAMLCICGSLVMGILSGCSSNNVAGSVNTNNQNSIEISSEMRTELDSLIKDKDYDSLIMKTEEYKDSNDELNAIYHYASALKSIHDEDDYMVYSNTHDIPSQYKERFTESINEEKESYKAQKEKLDIEKYKDKPPVIGETKEQLKTSSWGLPNDINKTTTGDNVSEQWVYNDGKYVYLNNGIVTAIQE
jgi:hypothetical protein